MIIHFGVADMPYAFSVDLGKSKSGKSRISMTGAVAEILEDKYKVMETFWTLHQDDVIAAMKDAIEGALESALMGAPVSRDAFAAASSKVQAIFQKFLDLKEMDGRVTGVPTAAALAGVSHRFKHPYAKHPSRPSFIDTGLFSSSFRCWVEE